MRSERIIYTIVDTPVGEFIAGATAQGCCLFEFADRGGFKRIKLRIETKYGLSLVRGRDSLIAQVESEVAEYFAGNRKSFSVPLDLKGTPFEMRVWDELLKIPYGETRAYGEVAVSIGKPGAARAVGGANGANSVAVIVPCHRVIQEDGSLRGYGGGLWRKKFLLDLESFQISSHPIFPAPSQLRLAFSP